MLLKLMLGVRKFENESYKSMQDIFNKLRSGQNPDVLFITCADSRVDTSLLTQTKPGELFVIRNVGNIIPPYPALFSEAAAAIEYALKVLQVKDIIICGHSDCGAIKGLFTPNLEGQLPSVSFWLNHAHPVLQEMEEEAHLDEDFSTKVALAIKKNVLLQLDHLRSHPLVAEKLANNELSLHGWFYDVGEGEVLIYEPQQKEFITLEKAFQLAIEQRKKRIVSEVAMTYLARLASPQTAKEYLSVIDVFSKLNNDVKAIWPAISDLVSTQLWDELGDLYSSPLDPEFTAIVKLGSEIRLDRLKDFQQNIQQSPGYHQYCSQLIRRSWFIKAAPMISIKELDVSNYLPYQMGKA